MGNFSDLPAEIMLDIFTRLPTEVVLDCKLVTKNWINLLRHPSFSQVHSDFLLNNNLDSAANSGKLSFILRMQRFHKPLCYIEYDDEVSSLRIKKLNLNPPLQSFSVVGSSNGLICIVGLHKFQSASAFSYVAHICNPMTRECVTLPEHDRSTYYHLVDFMSCGFGYVASTNKYKVVRIYTFRREQKCAQIEVYTLGSGKGWRNAGKIDNDSGTVTRKMAVFVDGFLYWCLGKGRIGVFDLADETFVGDYSELRDGHFEPGGVLGGYFSGTLYSADFTSSDVWLLKKKQDESLSWAKEFSLISMDTFTTSLALTSSDAVLCYLDKKLHLYDLKSSSSKMLKIFGTSILDAVPHLNTLVSLKALGEKNTQTLGSSESATKEAKGKGSTDESVVGRKRSGSGLHTIW